MVSSGNYAKQKRTYISLYCIIDEDWVKCIQIYGIIIIIILILNLIKRCGINSVHYNKASLCLSDNNYMAKIYSLYL